MCNYFFKLRASTGLLYFRSGAILCQTSTQSFKILPRTQYNSSHFTMEGSLNVYSFQKSLLFSITFTMEGSLLSNRSQICFSKHSLLNFRSYTSKGWRSCCSPKSYNLSLLCLPCLVLFKMANMISMSQRALPKVTSQRYISSQRYVPSNVTLKNLHFMTGAMQPSAGPR